MTDVRLFHEYDGGNVALIGDATYVDLTLDAGLETAAYLSILGGNERDAVIHQDNSSPDHPDRLQWWGNHGEPEVRKQRSEFGYLIRSIPAVSSNLRRLEQAATRDLAWFKDEGIASSVEVSVSLVSVNKVGITIRILVDNQEYAFAFEADWGN